MIHTQDRRGKVGEERRGRKGEYKDGASRIEGRTGVGGKEAGALGGRTPDTGVSREMTVGGMPALGA